MKVTEHQQQQLQQLPGVDKLLLEVQQIPGLTDIPKAILLRAIRDTLGAQRERIFNPDPGMPMSITMQDLHKSVIRRAEQLQVYHLQRTINATGVVVHTNLGRSCLAAKAVDHMTHLARHYSNLEFDLTRGKRGSRYRAVEDLLCELCGAEAAMVVNNNAAAVLLCLDTLARHKEVILSRGEMVEIGGAFRIPDVMMKSGAILKEIGTTNRTHLADYEKAIGTNTGLLLKVHTSNFSIVGFTASVGLTDLAALGRKFNLPVMEDLGSGNFIDLSDHGMQSEPTVQNSVSSGADVITFSGDKLLGGPQAGLIVGKKKIVDQIKSNPLTRALRIDKLTLAALEATLHLYRDPSQALTQIPTLRMITAQRPEIERKAQLLIAGLEALNHRRMTAVRIDLPSRAGGGALPLLELPSCCVGVAIADMSVNTMEKALRQNQPPIIGRIENDQFILDPRTLDEEEIQTIIAAFDHLFS